MEEKVKNELLSDFKVYVMYLIGKNYKKGWRWEARLRWALTKEWNHRYAKAGIPGSVRDLLGEEKATRLFQDTVDGLIRYPESLEMCINHYKTQQMFNRID